MTDSLDDLFIGEFTVNWIEEQQNEDLVSKSSFEKYQVFRNLLFSTLTEKNVDLEKRDFWEKHHVLINILGIRKEIIDNFVVTHALYASDIDGKEKLIQIADDYICTKPNYNVLQNLIRQAAGYFVYVIASDKRISQPCSARSAQALAEVMFGVAKSTAKQHYAIMLMKIVDADNKSLRLIMDCLLFLLIAWMGKTIEDIQLSEPQHPSAKKAYNSALSAYQVYLSESVEFYRAEFLQLFMDEKYPLFTAAKDHEDFASILEENDEYVGFQAPIFTLSLVIKELFPEILQDQKIISILKENNFFMSG